MFNLKIGCTKHWTHTSMHHIQLMLKGARITNNPLPIENPNTMFICTFGFDALFPTCPICGLFYSYNNHVLYSCGCAYHAFYLTTHLERRINKCANPTCMQSFLEEWLTSFGVNHVNTLQLKRGKLEKGERPTRNDTSNVQTSLVENCEYKI